MPLLNVDQAAAHLGTSSRFIRRLIAERRISFVKLGKHVRLDTADLDAFVAAGRVAATGTSTGTWGHSSMPSDRHRTSASGPA
jgi:excisionase family DNA binding protein